MMYLAKFTHAITVEPRSIVFQGDGGKNDECGKTINPENYYTL